MFSALAGMYMAAKVHFAQVKADLTKNKDRQVSETLYRNKVDKGEEAEKYHKSRMPESGYMTVEEYEAKSRPMTKKEISAQILDKADMPVDKNYVYVPQHKFKLVKYNDPVGSPELNLPRKLQFDRQINAQGIVSGDVSMLVYPAVYYYAQADCVSTDLFVIKLDSSLIDDVDKVTHANVLNREQKPILSTSKDIDTKFVFRTLTPIDFSKDNRKLIIKEKIGYRHDGIWKTDLWVYDFNKKQAKKLTALRDAIVFYWENAERVDLDEKRWDIYPMGFDANNDNRIIVCAYGYTGESPKYLGTWSIDVNNENTKLESISGANMPISMVGYRLSEEEEVKPMSELEFDAKEAHEVLKEKKKQVHAEKRFENEIKRAEYERKIRQMDMQTLMKVQQREEFLKTHKAKNGITNNMGGVNDTNVSTGTQIKNQMLPNLDNILNKFKKDTNTSN